jgi:hypothetical protein
MTDPTTAPILQTPLLVDYTNRDFYSLRDQLIQRVKDRVNNGSGYSWYGNEESDFGLALIEAFAYMGDVVSYYTDRVANEGNLLTASQRENVLNLAYSYGYVPLGYRSASCTVQFTNTNVGTTTSIPSGTQLRATITNNDVVEQVVFTTDADVSFATSTKTITGVSASSGTVTYTSNTHGFSQGGLVTITGMNPSDYDVANAVITAVATNTFSISSSATGSYVSGGTAVYAPRSVSTTASHGENVASRSANSAASPDISGETIGVSNGTSNQIFQLKETSVVDGSVEIFVVTGSGIGTEYGQWEEVTHLTDYGSSDSVFRTIKGSNNTVYVQFGDGISGAIPNNLSRIKARYVYGGGTVGNIPAGTLVSFNSGTFSGITVTNTTSGSGGLDPEGLDAIRTKAPQAFSALNRAVSLTDYEGLALQVIGAGKAKAVADTWSSVTLYLGPDSQDPTDPYPGKNLANSAVLGTWTTLQQEVIAELTPKLLLGSSLTVSPPTYTDVYVGVQYSKTDQVTDAQIVESIKQYLNTYYSYPSTFFGQIIHPEELEFIFRYVPGIQNVWVTELRRSSESGGSLSTLVGNSNEIFVFNSDRTTVTARSTDATLSAMSVTNGSLSPTFASTTLNYLLNIGSNTTTVIDPTATAVALGAKVTVDGTLDSKTITNSVAGTTVNVSVVVTAPDGRTLQTYTVAVYKSS